MLTYPPCKCSRLVRRNRSILGLDGLYLRGISPGSMEAFFASKIRVPPRGRFGPRFWVHGFPRSDRGSAPWSRSTGAARRRPGLRRRGAWRVAGARRHNAAFYSRALYEAR